VQASRIAKRFAVVGCVISGLMGALVAPSTAHAGDRIIHLKFRRSAEPLGVRFHYWGEGEPPALATPQEVTVVRRTRYRSDAEQDCYWVLKSALDTLAEQARDLGADTVIQVRSNWKHRPGMTPGSFDCAIGSLMVGVALRAFAGKVAPARPAPAPVAAATPVPAAPAGTVAVGRDPAGNATYQITLGDGRVGLRLVATPDVRPAQAKLALALKAAGETDRPHAACGVELESGGTKEPLAAPKYQRSAGQETLFTDVSVEQLRKLAGAGGALMVCATRVAIGAKSQQGIGELVHAVEAHIARSQPVKPGEDLSL
jgi:hypothetical protein